MDETVRIQLDVKPVTVKSNCQVSDGTIVIPLDVPVIAAEHEIEVSVSPDGPFRLDFT